MAFIIIIFLALPSVACADSGDFLLNGYTEIGKSSTSEDYDEEDEDNDYTYQRYHLRLKQELSDCLSYDIGSFFYLKDYKSKDSLDNISRIFNTSWSYYETSQKQEPPKFNLILKYKEKRYKDSPASEYDQIMASPSFRFSKKDSYTIYLTTGINNFEYLESGQKDQLKIFEEVELKRYFLNKSLTFFSSYKIETTDKKKANKKRTKDNLSAGLDYIFGLPLIYKITFRGAWGQKDTKEEEQRDEDFDYEYWQYYTKTEHKFTPRLKTSLKLQYFKKDYVSSDLDHSGFYIQNGLDFEIYEDKRQRFYIDFDLEHKDVDYPLKSGNDYKKETLKLTATYNRKQYYKTSASLQESFYDFNSQTNDKKRYYAIISGEKLFKAGDLSLSIDLKFRYTDYKQNDDIEEGAVKIGVKYKF